VGGGPSRGPGPVPLPGSYLRFLILLPCSTSFTASYSVSRETLLLRGGTRTRAQGRGLPRGEGVRVPRAAPGADGGGWRRWGPHLPHGGGGPGPRGKAAACGPYIGVESRETSAMLGAAGCGVVCHHLGSGTAWSPSWVCRCAAAMPGAAACGSGAVPAPLGGQFPACISFPVKRPPAVSLPPGSENQAGSSSLAPQRADEGTEPRPPLSSRCVRSSPATPGRHKSALFTLFARRPALPTAMQGPAPGPAQPPGLNVGTAHARWPPSGSPVLNGSPPGRFWGRGHGAPEPG